MKKFELKFYREWYDALAELSREDRAAAALALLEYAYDGVTTDDQFIRIVTTLMRNRIDREKSRSIHNQPHSSPHPSEEENQTSSAPGPEEKKSTPLPESSQVKINDATVSSYTTESSGEKSCATESSADNNGDAAVHSAENNGLHTQPDDQSDLQPIIPSEDSQIESVITSYYSSHSQSFLRICNKRDIDPAIVADRARIYLRKWIKDHPATPLPIPSRVIGTRLSPIDRFSVGLDDI